ncbi:MAG: hypothetical protein IJY56_04105 [Clostridia bacterium]|nr:hypothetical protein [Clostridia bacterium]
MSETKKRNTITWAIIATAAILILLGVLSLTIKTFVIDAILHIYLRLLFVPIVIKVLQKCFKDQLPNNMNKALIFCGCSIVLDLVVVDAFRYVLSNGISTVLFLPLCLPICFMIIMFYSVQDTGRDKVAEKRMTYILGIPLLLLSLYFEILSFVQI